MYGTSLFGLVKGIQKAERLRLELLVVVDVVVPRTGLDPRRGSGLLFFMLIRPPYDKALTPHLLAVWEFRMVDPRGSDLLFFMFIRPFNPPHLFGN